MLKFSSGAMLQQVNSAELCCLSSDAKLELRNTRKDLASWSCVWQRMLVCFAIEIEVNIDMIQSPQSMKLHFLRNNSL
jgi:hypothetical protein